MARHVAFLRAINVGGHVVTMQTLREEFEAAGFGDVETFIASGNVMFSSRSSDAAGLERKIERRLKARLGYDVATFLRSPEDVVAVARYEPFPAAAMRAARAISVGFLSAPLGAVARGRLQALTTDIDTFHVHGREIYWMCQKGQSDSKFSNAVMERALQVRATFRGINTIVRLAEKFDAPPAGPRGRGRA